MEMLIFLLILVAFALIAARWGFDSREKDLNNKWEHRQSFFTLKTLQHHL